MNIDDLKQYGLVNWNLDTASMESDTLTLDFCTLPGMQTPPLELGQEIELGNFYGRVWSIDNDFPAGNPVTLSVEVGGLISVLDKIPCVLLHGLNEGIEEESADNAPRLVRIDEVVAACNRAAAHAGLEIRYVGGTHPIMTPWSGGTDSIWSVLQNALRWAPCARTVCTGRRLTIYGLTDNAETPVDASGLQFTKRTNRTISREFDELPPPVVAARGGESFEYPAGANIYQPGAFVYQVPEEEANAPQEPGYGSAGTREAGHERNGQWMLLRGMPIPAGLLDVSASARTQMLSPVSNQSAWLDFWAQCGMAQTFSLLDATRFTFGSPVLSVQPGAVAYPAPPTPQTFPAGGKLGPAVEETNAIPANYHEFTASNAFYVLSEGSFPASTRAAGNVKGLTFCKGSIEQYVWLKGEAKNDDEASFFDGTTVINSNGTMKQKRYTVLKLETIFINRRYKRFQTGTNKLAPGDEDYGSGDALGNAMQAEQEAWKPDYRAALKAFYDATRALGEPAEEVTLFDVQGYVPGVTTLQEGFAASGIKGGMAGRMTYDAAGRTLTISNSRREVLGVDDYLQRQELGRRQQQNDASNRSYGVSSAGFPGKNYKPEESVEKASMVSPAVNATHAAGNVPAKKIPKWTLFCVGATWYLNGGSVGMGSKTVKVGVTPYMWTGGQPDATQTWGDPTNGKPRIRRRKGADGKLTFDLYQA